jgi:hypothetical protein
MSGRMVWLLQGGGAGTFVRYNVYTPVFLHMLHVVKHSAVDFVSRVQEIVDVHACLVR